MKVPEAVEENVLGTLKESGHFVPLGKDRLDKEIYFKVVRRALTARSFSVVVIILWGNVSRVRWS